MLEVKEERGAKDGATTPDGGWGWLVVLGSFCIFMIVDGIYLSQGVLLAEILDTFQVSRGGFGWIASLTAACIHIMSFFGTIIAEATSHRVACLIGLCISFTGLLLSTFANSIWTLYLTMGIINGIGFGFLLTPSILVVRFYFEKRKSLAMAIAACGNGIGVLVFPPFVHYLLDLYAWRGTQLILSGVILNAAVFAALFRPVPVSNNSTDPLLTTNHSEKKHKKAFNRGISIKKYKKLLRSPLFQLFIVSRLLLTLARFVPYIYLPDRARSLGMSSGRGALLVSVVGLFSLVGKLGFGCLGDHVGHTGRLCLFGTGIFMAGFCSAVSTVGKSFPALVCYAAIFGLSNGFLAITNVCVSDIFGKDNLNSAAGLLSLSSTISAVAGVPIAGYLFDASGSYEIPFWYAGLVVMAAGIFIWIIVCIYRYQVQSSSED